VKDTLQKLKILYSAGIVALTHHLTQTSAKITVKQQSAILGNFPEQTT
jgi:hypothetical protein